MTTGRVRAKARAAVRAARAELGGRHIDAPAEHAVEVHISVEPELVEDLEDFLRRVEGRAIRGKDDVVTVPLPPVRTAPRLDSPPSSTDGELSTQESGSRSCRTRRRQNGSSRARSVEPWAGAS